jgi:diaminopimelate epimerase
MIIKFSKYHGCGNDFVMIDNREGVFGVIDIEKIRKICNRHTGIGADGIILLENTDEALFRMRYFNALEGDETMCGNGARSIVAFARDLGLISDREISFLAHDGIHKALILENREVSVSMSDFEAPTSHNKGFVCNTGCPHYVETVPNTESFDLIPHARSIRYSPDFPTGINVNIVECDDELKMRTYERGVEEETLACGTGAVAVAGTLASNLPAGEEKEFSIRARGGNLKVRLTKTKNGFENVWLTGPAIKAFEGNLSL